MDHTRYPKLALHGYVHETRTSRSQGRPKERWTDMVKDDCKQRDLDIQQATEMTQHRSAWRSWWRGGGVGPAPSTGSVGDNSHNYSGRWRPTEGNWRWDPVLVLLWQVMVPRDPVNWTTPLLTPALYPCGSGISNPLHQRIVPCSRMSSTEGVIITLSLLDILQHREIGLCPAGATRLWAPRWVGARLDE